MPWPRVLPGSSAAVGGQVDARKPAFKPDGDPAVNKRLRGSQWVKRRRQILDAEPLCRHCLAKGRTRAAQEIDHINGVAHDNRTANLQPLCKACHWDKTRSDAGLDPAPMPEPKPQQEIGLDGWPKE